MEAHRLGLEVHLSTQLNISNWEALRFYAQFADVVVLARELNLDPVSYTHLDVYKRQALCTVLYRLVLSVSPLPHLRDYY